MAPERMTSPPLLACVLIGGKSSRMGQPKHLLNQAGSSWLERIVDTLTPLVDEVFLAGNGQIPTALACLTRLADVNGIQGPLAGILAALRFRPDALWLVFACDLPAIHAEAIRWLIAEAGQGGLAILPSLEPDSQRVEPLFAAYSGACLPHLEALAAGGNWRINQIRGVTGVRTPLIPAQFRLAWNNINTPAQLQRYLNETGDAPVSVPITEQKAGQTGGSVALSAPGIGCTSPAMHPADTPLRSCPPRLSPELRQRFGCWSSLCPYGLDRHAVYRQATFTRLDNRTMGDLLANGYRRNGNHMYTMRCPDCTLCVSIRLNPRTFEPDRNQRRILQKNKDIVVQQAPLTMSRSHLGLLDKFLRLRFNSTRSQAQSYYSHFFITTISTCFELRYWAGSDLVGIAIVDAAPGWLNAVYFYFDPVHSKRSPGTFNILNLVSFCRKHNIPHLYLGYWIDGLSAMAYKKAFKPHALLLDGVWQICT